ncbi:virion structural protein [Pseudomonas phage Psa21]|uniref:Virion structural protein n=1 Tax=Pseudomonas phage Psa21 TaxID=2530023 RepID=A0A481W5R1_9CAUD|nr:virion structural protein [Pseudomonas phage Psa21]QBJ02723.1 virion structural protein [Pseudomonas phage Psa21]
MITTDRFPYDMPSRDALVKQVNTDLKRSYKADQVSFEDMFFAPLPAIPGRTFIEMTNRLTGLKEFFVYRRLDLAHSKALGTTTRIKIVGLPTPANIANEINRSRKMTFGPDDISFSTVVINNKETSFVYRVEAMTGSYAYFGYTDITVEVVESNPNARYLEDGDPRLMETGDIRELEHA